MNNVKTDILIVVLVIVVCVVTFFFTYGVNMFVHLH